MKIHELKTVQPYFNQVVHHIKSFEVRKNDRDFKVGDYVLLREYEPKSNTYTDDNTVLVRITYILDSEEYCKADYVIFGFEIIRIDVINVLPF